MISEKQFMWLMDELSLYVTHSHKGKDYHLGVVTEDKIKEVYRRLINTDEIPMEQESNKSQNESDPVHSPSHYMQGHIETIDKIKMMLTPEEYLGYLKGNVLKYDRAPFKGNQEQDYDKQKVYYDWALEQMEGMQNEK